MNNPLISIIIPTYNSQDYIEEAIYSCLCQSYENIEIIIIDDGSTDNTKSNIEKIINNYKNTTIRYYRKENRGTSDSRNYGISIANGEYYYFLDSDDVLKNEALKTLYKLIIANDVKIVFGSWQNFIYENKEKIIKQEYKYENNYDFIAQIIKEPPVVSSFLVQKNHISWNNDLVTNEVLDYVFRNIILQKEIYLTSVIVTEIRQHGSKHRISNKYEHFNPINRLKIFTKFKSQLIESGLLNFERSQAIDFQIISNIYAARRRCMSINEDYNKLLNKSNLKRYNWYKKMGLTAFCYYLGVRNGVNIFYYLNSIFKRT